MAVKKDRVGEVRMMKCGLKAKIIAYRGSNYVDVMFEDGTIRTNKTYKAFLEGRINKDSNTDLGNKRLNEVRMMNCGLKARIIAYRKSNDMDVMFEDGTTRYSVSYYSFKNGSLTSDKSKVNKNRIGEERVMNCGMKAKIIAYRNHNDIDVMFEDGTTVRNRSYHNFVRGVIGYPSKANAEGRINEERVMNCGEKARIIDYRRSNDMDVMFGDGTVVRNCTYNNFVKGSISKEGGTFRSRVGEERLMNCGKKARITAYRSNGDIDVMFEDGTEVQNKTYANFAKGHIAYPKSPIGEERMMKCGEKAKIIGYRGFKDIDVMFADGTVRNNVSMRSFRDGTISKVQKATPEESKSRLGEVRMMSCGLKGKIIRYGGYRDIDVELEDKTVKTHRTYRQFLDGAISNKKRKNREVKTEIGDSIKLRCGFYAKLLAKDGSMCKLEYEDGSIIERPRKIVNQSPFWAKELKFIKVYTLKGVNFYVLKCKNEKYLGTVKEIKEQLETHREERKKGI